MTPSVDPPCPPWEADIVSFDRDRTVAVGMEPGPVPLEWVEHLGETTETFAHGNQMLVDEADIPGLDHVAETLGIDWGTHPEIVLSRFGRLEAINDVHPDAEVRFAVDDVFMLRIDPEEVPDGWHLFTPREFVQAFNDAFVEAGFPDSNYRDDPND